MSKPDVIAACTANAVQAAIADGVPGSAGHGPGQALRALGLAPNQRPSAVVFAVTVDRYDHAAAAAYLMRHHGATALAVLPGDRSNPPVGIITEADIIQVAADGKDLNKVRVRELTSLSNPARSPVRPGAAGLRAGSPAGR